MILSIGCPDEKLLAKTEDICRKLGGQIHRQRAVRSVVRRGQSEAGGGRGGQRHRDQPNDQKGTENAPKSGSTRLAAGDCWFSSSFCGLPA